MLASCWPRTHMRSVAAPSPHRPGGSELTPLALLEAGAHCRPHLLHRLACRLVERRARARRVRHRLARRPDR
eukprot:1878282-Prymnesium_polylepis.1